MLTTCPRQAKFKSAFDYHQDHFQASLKSMLMSDTGQGQVHTIVKSSPRSGKGQDQIHAMVKSCPHLNQVSFKVKQTLICQSNLHAWINVDILRVTTNDMDEVELKIEYFATAAYIERLKICVPRNCQCLRPPLVARSGSQYYQGIERDKEEDTMKMPIPIHKFWSIQSYHLLKQTCIIAMSCHCQCQFYFALPWILGWVYAKVSN